MWTGPEAAEFLQAVSGLGKWLLVGLALLLAWYIACRYGWPWRRKPPS